MATFVLVHGAWHGGWCWGRVAPLLRAAGHDVLTPTLTGLGERSHLASPEVCLSTHIEDAMQVLEYEDLREVILVGHSYGGMVITGVSDQMPRRLSHLIYLDAFLPTAGDSMLALLGPERAAAMRAKAEGAGDGWYVPADPLAFGWFGVTDPADQEWLGSKLAAQPLRTLDEPVALTRPGGVPLPRTYIRCNGVNASATFATLADRLRTDRAWRYRELPTGHDAMVTMPRELAALLLEVV